MCPDHTLACDPPTGVGVRVSHLEVPGDGRGVLWGGDEHVPAVAHCDGEEQGFLVWRVILR